MTSLETSDEDYRDPDFYLRTADAAFEAVCSLQLYIGHVAVKTRSHSRGKYGFDTHIDVQCQDSGKYRAHKNKKGAYKTSTRKTGCPFLAKIRRDGALERFEYKIVIENHNHEAVSEVLGSSIIRRTTQEKFGLDKLKALVADRSKNSANTARESSRQITADQPEVKIIAEDIHYIRRQLRAERYGPYTSTQAFIRMLQQDPHIFYWNIDRAANNTLCRFFWIYHAHLDQWRKNSQVLVMDNAYKVNRFNLPLLEVTSVTALNTNFSCGFGFAAKENAEFFQLLLTSMKTAMERANVAMPSVILSDFDHALKKALCSIFETTQQQLCVWHILKNVSVWHILKNVSFNVKKKWLGSLEGYIIMGHAKSDAARNIADIDTNPTTSPDFAFEDIWAENIIDEAEESASLMASHIVHKFTADLNSQISGPAASRKFEDTADGIIEAWDCVTYAPTEDEFRDNWDMLCREFSHQKPIIDYLHASYLPERAQIALYAARSLRNSGITSISRNESAHFELKSIIRNRYAELYELHEKIWLMTLSRQQEYNIRFHKQTSRRRIGWEKHPVAKNLIHRIGWDAMTHITNQADITTDDFLGMVAFSFCRESHPLSCQLDWLYASSRPDQCDGSDFLQQDVSPTRSDGDSSACET